jgi:MPBQ/MSBQ methyltransferase
MLPRYLDGALAAYQAGHTGRDLHLGYWDDPPPLTNPCSPAEFLAAQAQLTRRMVGLASVQPGTAVLDVACGLGGTLAMLGEQEGLCTVGLNIDMRQLRICQGASRGGLVAADACQLPFDAGSFDHLLCAEAMFHFTSRAGFLAEASRVLRPGGTMAVCDILMREPGSAPWPVPVMEDALRREYGPWPDIWVSRDRWSSAAGRDLPVLQSEDWTAATLPSYRVIAPDSTWRAQPTAAQVMRWLHESGHITYAAMAVRRR